MPRPHPDEVVIVLGEEIKVGVEVKSFADKAVLQIRPCVGACQVNCPFAVIGEVARVSGINFERSLER